MNNVAASNAQRIYGQNVKKQSKSNSKLSSGMRINSAADDAPGLAISEKMRAQIRGLDRGTSNVQDGVSLVQTADSGMQVIHDMLHRQRELMIQSMSDVNTSEDRANLQDEIDQLNKEINDSACDVKFNDIQLLNVPDYKDTVRFGRELIEDAFDAVMSVPDGTNAQIQSLFNEFTALSPPYDIDTLHGIAKKLSDQVELGNTAFVDIIETTNNIIKELGDSAFNPSLLTVYRNVVNIHYYDKVHYEGLYYGSASIRPKEALLESDPDVAHDLLNQAFSRNFANTGSGGAWDNGGGMVACHAPVSNAAWALLTNFNVPEDENELWVQAGANTSDGYFIDRYDCRPIKLGISRLINDPLVIAEWSLQKIDRALARVSEYRSTAGAQENRLGKSMAKNNITSENLSASESGLRDVDMAKEMSEYVKQGILKDSSTAMIAQANSLPQNVLSLFS